MFLETGLYKDEKPLSLYTSFIKNLSVSKEINCAIKEKLRHGRFCQTVLNKTQSASILETHYETENSVLDLQVKLNESFNDDVILNSEVFDMPSNETSFLLPNITHFSLRKEQLSRQIFSNQTYFDVLGFDSFTDQPAKIDVEFSFSINDTEKLYKKIQSIEYLMTVKERASIDKASLRCVFIDEEERVFSDRGCTSQSSPDLKNVTCKCNHATIFTIILSITLSVVPQSVQVSGLGLTSIEKRSRETLNKKIIYSLWPQLVVMID